MLNLRDEFDFLKGINNWNNHRVFLLLALSITRGDVLELGMGEGSTPFLAKLCDSQKRRLFSFDSNQEWAGKFQHLRSTYVETSHIKDWDTLEVKDYSVILVDHAPGQRRIVDIARFANHCDFMVIHDSEPVGAGDYRLKEIWHLFKYRMDYVTNGAWATIVSNTIQL